MGHFRKIGLAVAADQHSIQFNWFYSHFTEDTLKINIYSYYWTTSRILLLVQIVSLVRKEIKHTRHTIKNKMLRSETWKELVHISNQADFSYLIHAWENLPKLYTVQFHEAAARTVNFSRWSVYSLIATMFKVISNYWAIFTCWCQ